MTQTKNTDDFVLGNERYAENRTGRELNWWIPPLRCFPIRRRQFSIQLRVGDNDRPTAFANGLIDWCTIDRLSNREGPIEWHPAEIAVDAQVVTFAIGD